MIGPLPCPGLSWRSRIGTLLLIASPHEAKVHRFDWVSSVDPETRTENTARNHDMWQSTSELGSMTSECLPKKTNHRNTSPFLTVRFVADGHQTFTICQSITFDSDITMQHRRLETLSQLLLSICSARSIDIAQRCLTIY